VLAKFRVHGQSASATNHTNRLFRLTILDPLVVLHDFLYSKHYRALRQVIGCRQGPKYLKWLCYEKTVEAYTLLASKRLAAEPDATKSLTEWEAVCRAYPRLRLFIWQKHIIDYWKSHRVAFPPAVVRKIVRWFGVLS
jgi:hypothetical protein